MVNLTYTKQGIYIFFQVHLKKENESERNFTIAKLYPFSHEIISNDYEIINMENTPDKIDGTGFTISITSGIEENDKKIIGAAFNGTSTFEIVENATIFDIKHHLQREKSLLNFYHHGIYDWIIFDKIKMFLENQSDGEITSLREKVSELETRVNSLDNNIRMLNLKSDSPNQLSTIYESDEGEGAKNSIPDNIETLLNPLRADIGILKGQIEKLPKQENDSKIDLDQLKADITKLTTKLDGFTKSIEFETAVTDIVKSALVDPNIISLPAENMETLKKSIIDEVMNQVNGVINAQTSNDRQSPSSENFDINEIIDEKIATFKNQLEAATTATDEAKAEIEKATEAANKATEAANKAAEEATTKENDEIGKLKIELQQLSERLNKSDDNYTDLETKYNDSKISELEGLQDQVSETKSIEESKLESTISSANNNPLNINTSINPPEKDEIDRANYALIQLYNASNPIDISDEMIQYVPSGTNGGSKRKRKSVHSKTKKGGKKSVSKKIRQTRKKIVGGGGERKQQKQESIQDTILNTRQHSSYSSAKFVNGDISSIKLQITNHLNNYLTEANINAYFKNEYAVVCTNMRILYYFNHYKLIELLTIPVSHKIWKKEENPKILKYLFILVDKTKFMKETSMSENNFNEFRKKLYLRLYNQGQDKSLYFTDIPHVLKYTNQMLIGKGKNDLSIYLKNIVIQIHSRLFNFHDTKFYKLAKTYNLQPYLFNDPYKMNTESGLNDNFKNIYDEFVDQESYRAIKNDKTNRISSYLSLLNFDKDQNNYNPRYIISTNNGNDNTFTEISIKYDAYLEPVTDRNNSKPENISEFSYGKFDLGFKHTCKKEVQQRDFNNKLNELLDKQNVYIFGYGASGSGKTTTLVYNNRQIFSNNHIEGRGLIPSFIYDQFKDDNVTLDIFEYYNSNEPSNQMTNFEIVNDNKLTYNFEKNILKSKDGDVNFFTISETKNGTDHYLKNTFNFTSTDLSGIGMHYNYSNYSIDFVYLNHLNKINSASKKVSNIDELRISSFKPSGNDTYKKVLEKLMSNIDNYNSGCDEYPNNANSNNLLYVVGENKVLYSPAIFLRKMHDSLKSILPNEGINTEKFSKNAKDDEKTKSIVSRVNTAFQNSQYYSSKNNELNEFDKENFKVFLYYVYKRRIKINKELEIFKTILQYNIRNLISIKYSDITLIGVISDVGSQIMTWMNNQSNNTKSYDKPQIVDCLNHIIENSKYFNFINKIWKHKDRRNYYIHNQMRIFKEWIIENSKNKYSYGSENIGQEKDLITKIIYLKWALTGILQGQSNMENHSISQFTDYDEQGSEIQVSMYVADFLLLYMFNFQLNDEIFKNDDDPQKRRFCFYNNVNDLPTIMWHTVDVDRNINSTMNNPDSSRSHIIYKISRSGDKKNTLYIGDFAGIENEFINTNTYTLRSFIMQDYNKLTIPYHEPVATPEKIMNLNISIIGELMKDVDFIKYMYKRNNYDIPIQTLIEEIQAVDTNVLKTLFTSNAVDVRQTKLNTKLIEHKLFGKLFIGQRGHIESFLVKTIMGSNMMDGNDTEFAKSKLQYNKELINPLGHKENSSNKIITFENGKLGNNEKYISPLASKGFGIYYHDNYNGDMKSLESVKVTNVVELCNIKFMSNPDNEDIYKYIEYLIKNNNIIELLTHPGFDVTFHKDKGEEIDSLTDLLMILGNLTYNTYKFLNNYLLLLHNTYDYIDARRIEGEFINKQLDSLVKDVKAISYFQNPGSKYPDFPMFSGDKNSNSGDKNSNDTTDSCFPSNICYSSDQLLTEQGLASELIKCVITDGEKPEILDIENGKKKQYMNLHIGVYGVFNITPDRHNPPSDPYINITKLQKLYDTEVDFLNFQTDKIKNKGLIGDNNGINSGSRLKIYQNVRDEYKELYNRIKNMREDVKDGSVVMNAQIWDKISGSTLLKSSADIQNIEVSEVKNVLQKIFNNNKLTPIGTLDEIFSYILHKTRRHNLLGTTGSTITTT